MQMSNLRSSSRRRYVGVAQQLLTGIERGTFVADQALPPDRELAAQMGVSRATVREALLALEFIGVIEVRHGATTGSIACRVSISSRGGASRREASPVTDNPPACLTYVPRSRR
jgi:DNA-binding FadR family transcriptional regulator